MGANYVIWPWEVTIRSDTLYLNHLIAKYFGNEYARSFEQMRVQYPALLIVSRQGSKNTVVKVLDSNSSPEIILDSLIEEHEKFETTRVKDAQVEAEREEREKLRREQDEAYEASLAADRAKKADKEKKLLEEKRLQELAEKKRIAAEQEAEKKRIAAEQEAEKKRIAAEKESMSAEQRQKNALAALKPEPNEADTPKEQITRLKFRVTDGSIVQRKFLITDTLFTVFNFAASQGFFIDQNRMLTGWPKHDLTTESPDKTLEELKLFPQEIIIIDPR